MAQNEKNFIDTIGKVINIMYDLKLSFKSEPETAENVENNYIRFIVFYKSEPFYITVESNGNVLLTFNSDNTGFSTEPHILSSSPNYKGMKRITYGNKSIVNIENDIKNI